MHDFRYNILYRSLTATNRSVVLGLYKRRGGVLLRTRTTLTDRDGRARSEATQGTFIRGLKVKNGCVVYRMLELKHTTGLRYYDMSVLYSCLS